MIEINCDLCGKTTEQTFKTQIEGVDLGVCKDCSKFGKVISEVRRPSAKEQIEKIKKKHEAQRQERNEPVTLIVEDYSSLIKKKRESMNLSQKDFALKINEKESVIRNIETGSFEPPIELAKKIEKFLRIKLVEDYEENFQKEKSGKKIGFTLGDFIKVKK